MTKLFVDFPAHVSLHGSVSGASSLVEPFLCVCFLVFSLSLPVVALPSSIVVFCMVQKP